MVNFDYIKFASKKWDADILNLVGRIRECKGRQDLYVRQKPKELERLVEIAKIASTEASNKIEGIMTTNARIKQLFAEKTAPRNRDEQEIMGYRDVLNTIHESSHYIPIQPNYILQLHRDLLRRAGLSFGGQFKRVQNYINETLPNGEVVTRFTPLAPFETAQAIENLCHAYQQAVAAESIDVLLLIPIFVSDFLCIHPFSDGNGRMSRLLTLLLLYKNDFEVGKYISIEKQIEKTKDIYYATLNTADIGWHQGHNDPTPFIRYMLTVILACYTEFEDRVLMMSSNKVRSSAYDIVSKYVDMKIGKFTSADVVVNCPSIGRSSALAALQKMVKQGKIIKKGAGRATFYFKSDAFPIEK